MPHDVYLCEHLMHYCADKITYPYARFV